MEFVVGTSSRRYWIDWKYCVYLQLLNAERIFRIFIDSVSILFNSIAIDIFVFRAWRRYRIDTTSMHSMNFFSHFNLHPVHEFAVGIRRNSPLSLYVYHMIYEYVINLKTTSTESTGSPLAMKSCQTQFVNFLCSFFWKCFSRFDKLYLYKEYKEIYTFTYNTVEN